MLEILENFPEPAPRGLFAFLIDLSNIWFDLSDQ